MKNDDFIFRYSISIIKILELNENKFILYFFIWNKPMESRYYKYISFYHNNNIYYYNPSKSFMGTINLYD